MRRLPCLVSCLASYLAVSGCVIGYGGCLFLGPVKHSLTGHVHFHAYPAVDGIDNVPLLTLDRTAYVYAPAQSHQCLSANEVQLVGVAQFAQNIGENSHISIVGSLFEGVSGHQHTRFLVNVDTIVPLGAPH